MVDFSKLLKRPAGLAKKPSALPAGDFPGIVKSFEYGDSNKKKTPYVRFNIALTGWPDEIEDDDKMQEGADGLVLIDLAKRQLRRDYYLTEDALWRLDEFIRSTGVDPTGREYEEVIPELVGVEVLVDVQQYLNQENNEVGNQIGKLVGVAS